MPAFALNFYSPVVEAQLRSHRKTATIRLGDKSRKYQKGMIVSVLVGARYGPRQHVFDAVIDKVEVKRLAELSPREIEHDNPEVRRPEEMAHFLSQLYNREVTERGHRHGDPLLGDQADRLWPSRLSGFRIADAEELGSRSCAPHSSQSTAKVDENGAEHGRAAVDHLAAARRALGRDLRLELLEPAPGARRSGGRSPSSRRAPCAAPRAASPMPCPRRHPRRIRQSRCGS